MKDRTRHFHPPEHVGLHVLSWVGVALGDEGHGHSQARAFQDQVLGREARVSSVHPEVEGEVLAIAQHLVAQELLCG